MIIRDLARMAAGLALICFAPRAESAQCPPGAIAVTLTKTSDVQNLADALNCTGPGVVDVTWNSDLQLDRSIDVSNMKIVTVTGSGFPTIRGALGNDIDPGAIDDAGLGTGIFSVSNGSTLHLNNVALEGGGASTGGAVSVIHSSSLFVSGCSFTSSNGIKGGAIYADDSKVHIDGSSSFTQNTAELQGGAMYGYESVFVLDGDTVFSGNYAYSDGGAVFAQSSNISANGNTEFYDNIAKGMGGAVFTNGSNVYMEGHTEFSYNSADSGDERYHEVTTEAGTFGKNLNK